MNSISNLKTAIIISTVFTFVGFGTMASVLGLTVTGYQASGMLTAYITGATVTSVSGIALVLSGMRYINLLHSTAIYETL